jgi:hypothetical protein
MDIVKDIQNILSEARQRTVNAINITMVKAYWLIGKRIVEETKKGETRAMYGKELLKKLSESLPSEYKKGFSVDNLQNMRLFYLTFQKYETLSRKLEMPDFQLTWSYYLVLNDFKFQK